MARPSNFTAVVNGNVVSMPPKAFKSLLQGIVSNAGVNVPEGAKTQHLTLTPVTAQAYLNTLFPSTPSNEPSTTTEPVPF